MARTYQVVDLFAGPGGLAEGFSAFADPSGHHPYDIALSVEKEASAHRTLQLRAFLRQLEEIPDEYYKALNGDQPMPDWSIDYESEWEDAQNEALRLEMGTAKAAEIIDKRLAELITLAVPTVVIGGPPCQAYSIVGRARNKAIEGYVPEEDKRHYLYREYIRILERLKPVAFVMENVKGILSSSLDGSRIFDQVLADLRAAAGEPRSYELYAVALDPEGRPVLRKTTRHVDFIVRAEAFGVPQARHRVIVVGIRRDIADRLLSASETAGLPVGQAATVRDVLDGLPKLRSGLSRSDEEPDWRRTVIAQMEIVCSTLDKESDGTDDVLQAAEAAKAAFMASNASLPRSSIEASTLSADCPEPLAEWLEDARLEVTLNHASRGHMIEDLGRYFFSAIFTDVRGRAPKANEFPDALAPDHANWSSGKFADRFRTQGWNAPSTTVTSHISKDGHYFIHPDARQCRSLTVREAARLQTFPDNYLFLGNRTEQYVQVGNAVPPFLARQIADVLSRALAAAG